MSRIKVWYKNVYLLYTPNTQEIYNENLKYYINYTSNITLQTYYIKLNLK